MNQDKESQFKKYKRLTNPIIFEENIDQEEEIKLKERNSYYDYNIVIPEKVFWFIAFIYF